MSTTISSLPAYPTQGDTPADFETKAHAFVEALADTFVDEVNALAGELETIYDDVAAIANYKGAWSGLSGALDTPASVLHDGVFWILLTNLADVTASEPSDTNSDWMRSEETRTSFSNSTFSGSLKEGIHALSGTTPDIDPGNNTIQTHTLSGNTTYTDDLEDGESLALFIDDGSGYTVTWPTMTWLTNDGDPPTLKTTGYTVVIFLKFGSTLYGFGKGAN